MFGVNIFMVLEEDAPKYKRDSINKLALKLQKIFDDGIMENTLFEMAKKGAPGKLGNCHYVARTFMYDLIVAKQAKGWSWVRGINSKRIINEKPWEHSWIEYGDFAVDLIETLKDSPKKPTVSIGEVKKYYKRLGITKILKRRDGKNTLKWLKRNGYISG